MPTHVHVSLILGRIDAGERLLTVAGTSRVLRPGDGLIITPDTAYSWTAAADAAYRVVVLDPADFQMATWRSGRVDATCLACFSWGLTPAEQRLAARLRQARRLSLAGLPIAEVATAVGFADQSHLNRAFRRLMGVPPGRWVRQIRRR